MSLKNFIPYTLVFLILGANYQKALAIPASAPNFTTTNLKLDISAAAANSPLANKQFQLPTAFHLNKGEFIFAARNRFYFLRGTVREVGTTAYLDYGLTWAITDNAEVSIQSQRVDTNFPVTQGEFFSIRNPANQNFFLSDQELTLQLKQRIWQNPDRTRALSAVLSLSLGDRGFRFESIRTGALVDEGTRSGIVPALQLPFTSAPSDRLTITFSPAIAFFQAENALHIHRSPVPNPGSFGTTLGLGGAISYHLASNLILWADAFIPVTGNNSIDRSSGNPAKTVAYNFGLRYLVNPRLGIDLFASNTQGSLAPLSFTVDRELTALGLGVSVLPDFILANRRYRSSIESQTESIPTRVSHDGIAFFDGGTIPANRFIFNLQGGSQGILTALRFGMLDNFELGTYLDYVAKEVDESEQGFSGKIRFFDRIGKIPLAGSFSVTLGLTNEPFANFLTNNKNEFSNRNLTKSIPFFFQADNDRQGRRYIFTLSFPLNYQFDNGTGVWFTPILGYAQRLGTEIIGFNTGAAVPIFKNFSILGEMGANFAGNGNAFIGNNLENVIPWNVALRWNPSSLLKIDLTKINPNPFLELYLTNRVGSSTWHQLRVRDRNDLAIGVGVSIPF